MKPVLPEQRIPLLDARTGLVSRPWFDFFRAFHEAMGGVEAVIPPSSGGLGISSGISGGVLAFTATDTLASSALLTNNAIVMGGGAGATPKTPLGLGTANQVLHGNAAGAPTWGGVSLSSDVSGTLAVSSGGTGAGSAADARTNLGLVVGTDVQAFDADLSAIAALGSTGLAARTAANTWAQRTITGTASQITVSNGNGVSGNPTISLPGTMSLSGHTIESVILSGCTVASGLLFNNAVHVTFNTGTGTKLGTATGQKIGLWNVTPIIQPASANQAATVMGNADNEIGGLSIGAAYNQAEIQALRDKTEELADDVRALHTLTHAMRTAMVDFGSMKGAA